MLVHVVNKQDLIGKCYPRFYLKGELRKINSAFSVSKNHLPMNWRGNLQRSSEIRLLLGSFSSFIIMKWNHVSTHRKQKNISLYFSSALMCLIFSFLLNLPYKHFDIVILHIYQDWWKQRTSGHFGNDLLVSLFVFRWSHHITQCFTGKKTLLSVDFATVKLMVN